MKWSVHLGVALACAWAATGLQASRWMPRTHYNTPWAVRWGERPVLCGALRASRQEDTVGRHRIGADKPTPTHTVPPAFAPGNTAVVTGAASGLVGRDMEAWTGGVRACVRAL